MLLTIWSILASRVNAPRIVPMRGERRDDEAVRLHPEVLPTTMQLSANLIWSIWRNDGNQSEGSRAREGEQGRIRLGNALAPLSQGEDELGRRLQNEGGC